MGRRTAYLGLTGPAGYDYKEDHRLDKKTRLGERFPNPILEAPLGLMTLYDEVVFLDEAVCPKNMVDLDFIKFLSDRKDISNYLEDFELQKEIERYGERKWQGKSFPFKEHGKFMKSIVPFAIYDNHSRPITSTSSLHLTPNSADLKNVIYDKCNL